MRRMINRKQRTRYSLPNLLNYSMLNKQITTLYSIVLLLSLLLVSFSLYFPRIIRLRLTLSVQIETFGGAQPRHQQ